MASFAPYRRPQQQRPRSSSPDGGLGGYTPPGQGPTMMNNNAGRSPELDQFLNFYRDRIGTLQGREAGDRAAHDARTKQMIGQTQGNIADAAAGANAATSEALAMRGTAGGGEETQARSGISQSAQREQAKAATNIALEQNRDFDAKQMARENMVNQFMAGGMQAFAAPANLGLAQQSLGIQQFNAMNNARNSELDRWLEAMRMSQQQAQAGVQTQSRRRSPGLGVG